LPSLAEFIHWDFHEGFKFNANSFYIIFFGHGSVKYQYAMSLANTMVFGTGHPVAGAGASYAI